MLRKLKERFEYIKEHRLRHQVCVDHATSGLIYALKSQPNFKYHLFFSVASVYLGIALDIDRTEWAIVSLTIALGLIVEMLNTTVESVVDLVTKEWRQDAKIAKDVSAGMMLLTAVSTVIVATILFLPKMVNLSVNLLK